MKTASISEAKNSLSALVDRVRRGETVLISDRGRPVAQLAPLAANSTESARSRLADLERRGVLRRARSKPPRRLPPPVVLPSGSSVLAALLEDRDQGR